MEKVSKYGDGSNNTELVITDKFGNVKSIFQKKITLTTTGSTGPATFVNNILNIPEYSSALTGYVPNSRQLTINGTTYDLSANRTWNVGTVTSVGVSMPSAFAVANSPITSSGTIAITGAGTTAEYIDGTGALRPFPGLTGYVPYIGATQNVDLGEFEIKAGQFTFDVSPTGTATVGTTRWNNTIGSSETTLKGGTVILKNGVDLVARVVNRVTPNTTLTRATYPAVRVSGAAGQRLAVAYAQANNDLNSADTIGLVIETIPTNQEGFIMTVGQLLDVNTTGSLQGETWLDGDVLYLSPTTPGALTNIKPTGLTGHIVVMGYVEYAHAIHGSIYVKIMNGWELDELHNVYINNPLDNQGLFYSASDQLWKNKSISTALGYTPIATTRQLTINGTTYDLSANRTWNVGTVTSVDMTVPTGLTVSGNPITGSGTLALGFASGYSIPTTANQTNWNTAYNRSITGFSVNYGSVTTNLILTQQDSSTINLALIAGAAVQGKFVFFNGSNLAYGSLSASAPLSFDQNSFTFSIAQASATSAGYLSAADWIRFNAKQPLISGVGIVYSDGTNISYITDNSSNWNTAYSWGNHASVGYITPSYLDDYTRGSYRVISDYGSHTTWYLRSNGQFIWGSGHDWTASFRLNLGGYGSNSNWAYFGQQDSNAGLGTWRGVRIRKYDGGSVDGDLSAGAYYIGDTRKDTNWDAAYSWGNHATQGYATTSYVSTQISNLINGAPGALDTLDELAAALGDDANFASTVTNSIATKLPLAGGTMSGTIVLNSISGTDQVVENTYGAYLHLGAWGVGRLDSTAVLVNTAYRADYADSFFDMRISRLTNDSGYITSSGSITGNAATATYATNATRLYASDAPYRYTDSNPYYLYMNYDGGSYWELKVAPATPGTVRVAYANSAGNADTVDNLHASSFLRSDTYNSNYGGLQVFRNIGTSTGGWPDTDHTFGLENSDAGYLTINFHRAGYTSHNLLYTGSTFRFDTNLESTATIYASGGNSSQWNTAYSWGNHSGLYLPLSGGTVSGNINVGGEIAFRDGGGAFSNIIRAATYPSEGYTGSQTFWLEYRAKGGHHFVLNTDGGSGSAENPMDDFVVWQGNIDGDRLLELSNAGNLRIRGTFTELSSRRFKENIKPLEPTLSKVQKLEPVTYTKTLIQEEEIGLIAEDVAELFPEVVTYDEDGTVQGIQYQRLSVILLKAVQELTDRITKLENK